MKPSCVGSDVVLFDLVYMATLEGTLYYTHMSCTLSLIIDNNVTAPFWQSISVSAHHIAFIKTDIWANILYVESPQWAS